MKAELCEELLVQRSCPRARLPQKPDALSQLLRIKGPLGECRIIRRSNADDLVVSQRLGNEPTMDRGRSGNRDIGRTVQHAFEYVLAVADIEREPDVGMPVGERPHQRRDERLRRGRHRCDLQPAGSHGARFACCPSPVLEPANHIRRVRFNAMPASVRTDSPASALEQVNSDLSSQSREG
ncbi:MAG: hypothetical protein M3076_18100 [Actinomycetota bacterium]|nr:hypothetical protein [Actinomycetota bacterium]